MSTEEDIQLLRNMGSRTFVISTVASDRQAEVELGDVNGDSRTDVVGVTPGNVNVFSQLAGGAFVLTDSPQTSGPYGGDWGHALEVADITRDGEADVIATSAFESEGRLDVWEGGGSNLQFPETYKTEHQHSAVEAGDVNGDNALDVVTSHSLGFTTWLNQSDGGLGSRRTWRAYGGSPQKSLAIAGKSDSSYIYIGPMIMSADSLGLVIMKSRPLIFGIREAPHPERAPAISKGRLLWAESRGDRDDPWHVFYQRRFRGAPIRLNESDEGFAGGIDGSRIAYQQYRRRRSDIKIANVKTGVRSSPRQLSTAGWERNPSLSGNLVLFARDTGRRSSVIVYDVRRRRARTLQTTRRGALMPGQVNGHWAVWTHCRSSCVVVRHNLRSGDRTMIRPPSSFRLHYAPAVSPWGAVYYASSRYGCGRAVKLYMRPPHGGQILITSLFRRHDVYSLSYGTDQEGRPTLVYDELACVTPPNPDVFQL